MPNAFASCSLFFVGQYRSKAASISGENSVCCTSFTREMRSSSSFDISTSSLCVLYIYILRQRNFQLEPMKVYSVSIVYVQHRKSHIIIRPIKIDTILTDRPLQRRIHNHIEPCILHMPILM